MAIEVKICGITQPDALEAAVAGGARWVGFVFYPPSPRALDAEGAFALSRLCADSSVEPVGVYVDPGDALLDATAGAVAWMQLHGGESPERVREIKQRWGKRIIKAVPVAERGDRDRAAAYAGCADRLLFDAKPAPGDLPGGTGRSFARNLLAGFDPGTAWLLSGGLTAETLPEAVAESGAKAVDVSSGVEERPGGKDVAKIAAFLGAAQALAGEETVS